MLDGNPLEWIKTGDYVEPDADRGIVTVGAHPSQKIQPQGRTVLTFTTRPVEADSMIAEVT
jgi:hypothetical protein